MENIMVFVERAELIASLKKWRCADLLIDDATSLIVNNGDMSVYKKMALLKRLSKLQNEIDSHLLSRQVGKIFQRVKNFFNQKKTEKIMKKLLTSRS